MDKKALQSYAVWAKNNLENQIEVALKSIGINSASDIKQARVVGEYTIIDGDMNSYPSNLYYKREKIINLVQKDGYEQAIEEFAYTWFNRIIALRFMEVHNFLPHGFRVLSSRDGGFEPEIMKNLNYVADELHINLDIVSPLIAQGKIDDAFRYVLFKQCNALSGILPMLFKKDDSYMEFMLPKALLKGETFITNLIELGEEPFLNEVEVIGWLYQFYISQKKDAVFASKEIITKENLPAATQLFTPDWIVKYMAENSVGRIWLESYPNSSIKSQMKYYVDDAKQEDNVQKELDKIKYKNVKPEEIKIIEPCCGSGHILVYVFDLLYKMYEEKGYQPREIPTIILKKNLIGLDVDKRASQLASFALVMKARTMNSRFFNESYYTIPKVYEVLDSKLLKLIDYKKHIIDSKLLTEKQIESIELLVDSFENAKTIGTLLKVVKQDFKEINYLIEILESNGVRNLFNDVFYNEGIELLKKLLNLAIIMSDKYDVMITNPPYKGSDELEKNFKDYIVNNYPDSKKDLCTAFMETSLIKTNGFEAMINMHSWMFLSSYEKLRKKIIKNESIVNMIHLGTHAFEMIGGEIVQTTTFVIRNSSISNLITKVFNLTKIESAENKKLTFLKDKQNGLEKQFHKFESIPGFPFCYDFDDNIFDLFKNKTTLSEHIEVATGLSTSDNNRFLRLWHEVSFKNIEFLGNLITSNCKWYPMAKGGQFKKWYGNNDYIINYGNNGKEIKEYASSLYKSYSRTIKNIKYYCKEGMTWSALTTGNLSMRYMNNSIFGSGASCAFTNDNLYYLMAFLNSSVINYFMSKLNPTINANVTELNKIPYVEANLEQKNKIIILATENIKICKNDYEEYEQTYDFKRHPLVNLSIQNVLIYKLFKDFEKSKEIQFNTLKENEENIDEIFQNIYELKDITHKSIPDKLISIEHSNLNNQIKSLISYFIGVVMGRYSLDVEGLAYAGGDWNSMNYITYQPDEDGIVSIYSQLGMEDGLTTKIINLIKKVYGEDTYRENIDFIAEALGKNSNESSEETLNRYLNDGFYPDHLKIYQKRPIYWMFSSGKNNAFKCLIYLHRYTKDTLAIINSKYFLNESAGLNAEVDDTRLQLESAEGRDRLRLDKQYKHLQAKQKEMIEYGQVLDHMANMYIDLDLDDGVKVNYAKFQGIEIVNDNGAKIKKDLLVPIK